MRSWTQRVSLIVIRTAILTAYSVHLDAAAATASLLLHIGLVVTDRPPQAFKFHCTYHSSSIDIRNSRHIGLHECVN